MSDLTEGNLLSFEAVIFVVQFNTFCKAFLSMKCISPYLPLALNSVLLM